MEECAYKNDIERLKTDKIGRTKVLLRGPAVSWQAMKADLKDVKDGYLIKNRNRYDVRLGNCFGK